MKRLYHFAVNLLFPPKCVLCGKLLAKEETDLCKKCRTEAPLFPNCKRKLQFLDSFTSVWYYEGNVRRSLLQFKFYGRRQYASSYGRLLAMAIQQAHPEGVDLITWIPVSDLRRFRRGYDQVALIAEAIGKEVGMSPVPTLRKIRHNQPQSHIQGAEMRRANVLGVYRGICPEMVRNQRVLLVDDILTTGATASEAAKTLKIMGAKEVHCAAVAAARKE